MSDASDQSELSAERTETAAALAAALALSPDETRILLALLSRTYARVPRPDWHLTVSREELLGGLGATPEEAARLASLIEPDARLLRLGLMRIHGTARLALTAWAARALLEGQVPAVPYEIAPSAPPPPTQVQARAAGALTCRGLVHLCGANGSGRDHEAAVLASLAGRARIDLRTVPDAERRHAIARAAAIDAVLILSPEQLPEVLAPAARVVIQDETGPPLPREVDVTAIVRTQRPPAQDLPRIWRALLDRHGLIDVTVPTSHHAQLTPAAIEAVVSRAARARGALGRLAPSLDELLEERPLTALGPLATRVPHGAAWSDLIITPETRAELDLILTWARTPPHQRPSRNLVALFHGPPGTGKTLAARVIATSLASDLYRIDLSRVVDKYIGETEKNLGRLFDSVAQTNAVLLFDEADALFGRRTETSSANDRYANLETGYLLQRIEDHDGLVLLTSNLRGNIDSAFSRRIFSAPKFAAPDEANRLRIWDLHLPPTREADVDLPFIARGFEFAGGDIRNASIAAQLLAKADGCQTVSMAHVVRAIQRELQRAGRAIPLERFGRWAPTVATGRSRQT